jgi:hypothetical protein
MTHYSLIQDLDEMRLRGKFPVKELIAVSRLPEAYDLPH